VQGRSFLNLDIGLPVAELRAPMRACLQGEADHREALVNAVNRRGKSIKCQVTCTPLHIGGKSPGGVIILMNEA
jgi:two-component system CheB/CheR fusion protein